MNALGDNEFERQRRIIDQMLTQHSRLRDRYDGFARWLDVTGIVLSAVLTALSLMKDEYWQLLRTTPRGGPFVAAIAAAILLGLSIVQYRVQWKEKAEAHGAAATTLATWKAKGRMVPKNDAERTREWVEMVAAQLSTLPAIPDRLFLKLKGAHLRKEETSRRMSQFPGSTPWFVSLRVRLAADVAQLLGKRDDA
jgi:hypothetical protein